LDLNSKNTFKTNTEKTLLKESCATRIGNYHLLESGNIWQINAVTSTTKSVVIKSLIIISKYIGCN
jgi:hypothetical protein